jgi:hypothetical protein
MPESNANATGQENKATEIKTIDHALLARLVIREGKPFITSALEAGYSESVARCGIRRLMADSSLVSEAIRREYEAMQADVTKLKPVAVARLYREIAAPDAPNAMKAIELAGRFKETDWFVRNVDMQMGVFLSMTDQTPAVDDTDKFKE